MGLRPTQGCHFERPLAFNRILFKSLIDHSKSHIWLSLWFQI